MVGVEAIVRLGLISDAQKGELEQVEIDASEIKELGLHVLTDFSEVDKPTSLSPKLDDFVLEGITHGGRKVLLNWENDLLPEQYVWQPIEVTVTAGSDIVFTNLQRRQIHTTTFEIALNESLTIKIDRQNEQGVEYFGLDDATSLSEYLKNLKFLSYVHINNGYEVDGQKNPLTLNTSGIQDDIDGRIDAATLVIEVLDKLGISPDDIEPASLSDKTWNDLQAIHPYLVHGKTLPDEFTSIARMPIKFGSQLFELMVNMTPDGELKLLDLFSIDHVTHLVVKPKDETVKPFFITRYDMLNDETFTSVANLHLETLPDAYVLLPERPELFENAKRTVVRLIGGAHLQAHGRRSFLKQQNYSTTGLSNVNPMILITSSMDFK